MRRLYFKRSFILFALAMIVSVLFSSNFPVSYSSPHNIKSQGLSLQVPDDVFPLVKIETSNDKSIFKISEIGSIKAAKKLGQSDSGAGWIFSISKVSSNTLCDILQNDASGTELFAFKDGAYYLYNHPTDVRYVRENNSVMQKDMPVWTRLNEWGYKEVRDNFIKDNGLNPITADNSDIGIALARVMYDKNIKASVTSLATGKLKINSEDAKKYLKNLLYDAKYTMTDESEPDGEYISINVPKDKLTLRFYYGEKNKNYVAGIYENSKPLIFKGDCLYARAVATEVGKLCQASAEREKKIIFKSGDSFIGAWYESIAGRGQIEIKKAGSNYKIAIRWAESAFSTSFWNMTAKFENGALVYNDCEYKSVAYNEKGIEKITPHYKNGAGEFKILPTGELVWNDIKGNAGNDSVFLINR